MDVFLDTCIIIGLFFDIDDHHNKVIGFFNSNKISSKVTCEKVREEVNKVSKKYVRKAVKEGLLSYEEGAYIMEQIRQYLQNIFVGDFKALNPFLFNDLEIELGKVLKNYDDREVFANAVLWNVYHNPDNPCFLTVDGKDYKNVFGIMLTVANCLKTNGHDVSNLKRLIRIVIL